MKIELAKSEIIHFIGIGGIGMSGLALIMQNMGFKVQGTDISSNKNIERLKKNKIKIKIGHKKNNINKATIIVISSAIKNNNPEIKEAKNPLSGKPFEDLRGVADVALKIMQGQPQEVKEEDKETVDSEEKPQKLTEEIV